MKTLNFIRITSTVLMSIVAIGTIASGVIYLTRADIMPYHYSYLAMTKVEISTFNPRIIEIMMALMKVSGSASIGLGIVALYVSVCSFHNGSKWAWWTLLVAFTSSLFPVLIITYAVAAAIPDGLPRPPWWITMGFLVLLSLALLGSLLSGKKRDVNK